MINIAKKIDKTDEQLLKNRISDLYGYVNCVNRQLHEVIDTLAKVRLENSELKKIIDDNKLVIAGLTKDIEILEKTNRLQQETIDWLFTMDGKNVYANY